MSWRELLPRREAPWSLAHEPQRAKIAQAKVI